METVIKLECGDPSSSPNQEAVVSQGDPADASAVGSLTASTSGAESRPSAPDKDKEPLVNGLEENKEPVKEYVKPLSGGAKKRFWWLVKNGHDLSEAHELAIKPTRTSEKRKRSAITTAEEISKRSRAEGQNGSENSCTTLGQMFSDIKIGIVTNDFPETLLTMEQQKAIEEDILSKVEESGADISPQFHNSAFMPGFLLIICDGEATAKWLKSVIEGLNPWREIGLKAVEGDNIPQSIIMTGFFPHSSGDKNERILALMKSQNKQLEIEKWKLLKREDKGTATLMVFFIDQHSETTLKLNNFKLNYKFGKVRLTKSGRGQKSSFSTTMGETLEKLDNPNTPNTSKHNKGKRFFKNQRYGKGNIFNRLGGCPTKF
ncbi:UNVERIFIED_CONTAM: hypothetical protein RMT77_014545 [Armadillidium vulgare]